MSRDTNISVLFIEDSPSDALLVQEAFAAVPSAPFTVTHTTRLSAGIQHLHQGLFAAVLLDLGLPDSQGLGTLTTLRRQVPETPVVVLTSLTDETLAMQAVQAGAQDYLLKGEITGPLLGRTLRYAIERKRVAVMQARLAAIVDNSADAIIGKTLDGVIMSWNAGAERMYGYTATEVVGRSIALLIPRETAEDMPYLLACLQRGEHIAAYETIRVRKDGIRLDVSLTVSPIRNDLGQIVGAAAITRDITPQKRAERALQQQRDWFNVTLSSIGEGVMATDTTGHITFINAVAAALTGWRVQEALGRPITEVFRMIQTQTRQPVDDPLQRALQEGRVVRPAQETLLLTADAGALPIAVSASPMCTEDGELLGAVLVCRDMSEQRQMEEDLLRARKIESVGILAGGLAHDFNNLLTGILGNVSLAKLWAKGDANVVVRLTEAEKACERATALTHQLLTFAKGGAPVRHTVALGEAIQESARFVLRGANVRGALQIPADLWPVNADAGQINQVIHNVILNAVQAMPEGGTVQVQAHNVVIGVDEALPLRAGRYLKIIVQDHGFGIPREILPNIFDPYVTTKIASSGLGLTTAYHIVAKHEGHIDITSEVAQGTTVAIYLPASQQTLVPVSASPATALQGSGRILVMDDEEMICDLLHELLSSLGYQAECVRDGTEAVAVYQRAQVTGQPFAAVILDHTIPGGMGGRETITRLRVLNPQIKAILSSGYANDPMMADYTHYGFSGVVAKPYTVAKLQEALYHMLQGGAASADT